MPNLNEGTLLYMPTTLPGLSVTKSAELLQMQDRIIRSFPEVASVYGKAGRAQTATDPAPIEMFETIINLKPKEEWRPGLTVDGLIQEMDRSLQFPGVSNAWTMPIKARIDMLSTGIRTPVGVKVIGKDLAEMEKVARQVETVLKTVPGTSSAYAERVVGGYYLEIVPDRDRLARYGLMICGRAGAWWRWRLAPSRSPPPSKAANATRWPSAIRATCAPIRSPLPRTCWCRCPAAAPCRWAKWRTFRLTQGATSIRTENAKLATYIFVDIRDRDLGGYVADAKKAVAEQVKLPAGTYLVWSGQFEYLERAEARLQAGGAGDADDHLPAALPQLPAPHRNAHRHAVAAVRAGRRAVADVVARIQHVGGGGGRLHRAGRRRRRDRRRDADLPRPRGRGDPRALPPTRDGRTRAPISTRPSWSARSSACGPR